MSRDEGDFWRASLHERLEYITRSYIFIDMAFDILSCWSLRSATLSWHFGLGICNTLDVGHWTLDSSEERGEKGNWKPYFT